MTKIRFSIAGAAINSSDSVFSPESDTRPIMTDVLEGIVCTDTFEVADCDLKFVAASAADADGLGRFYVEVPGLGGFVVGDLQGGG